jgi:hypothetical protein
VNNSIMGEIMGRWIDFSRVGLPLAHPSGPHAPISAPSLPRRQKEYIRGIQLQLLANGLRTGNTLAPWTKRTFPRKEIGGDLRSGRCKLETDQGIRKRTHQGGNRHKAPSSWAEQVEGWLKDPGPTSNSYRNIK